MSLDIYLTAIKPTVVFESNYTHNVTPMADAAGLYVPVWRPEEAGVEKASKLIPILREGIAKMKSDPARFIALNPKNGWGSYDTFLPWLERLLVACEENPDATVEASP